jgi:molybdopterin converting factor small subunit
VYTKEQLAKLEENTKEPVEKTTKDTSDATIQNLRSLLKEKDKILSDLQINLDYVENIIKDIDQTERVVKFLRQTQPL